MHILKVFYCVISNFTLNPLAALVYKGIKRLYTVCYYHIHWLRLVVVKLRQTVKRWWAREGH